jgi:predicted lipoprotein with Yx(FWY)xxD motif
VGDEVPNNTLGAGVAGWSPVILLPLPTPPEGIKIVETPESQVYTDKNGMTVYWLICHEENAEHLSCDREGDTMAYMHGLCGGRERCADTFKLIRVTDESRGEDKMWSIRKVDLKNPLRKLGDDEEGTKVWLYNRRLVFTYGGDLYPGQMYGNGVRLQQLADVVYLPAYGATAD